MSAGATIALDAVERHYETSAGLVRAVNGVSLTLAAGRHVALIGPSGSGKSTLLGMIGGLERPSAGRVLVAGVSVGELNDEALAAYRRRQVGFIFQAYDLLPYLTVAENVALQAAISGTAGADIDELLDDLGLAPERDKLPDQLSGGQKQRVGIARCLVHRPAVVLADEPTGELDSVTSARVIKVLLERVGAIGATALVVTHDHRVAANFERIITLTDGRIQTDARSRVGSEATPSFATS
jgi:putative ABC transport system ATP-binding protein